MTKCKNFILQKKKTMLDSFREKDLTFESKHGEWTNMKTKIKFPFVESFHDYHDIDYKKDDFNQIFVEHVKGREVAFDGQYYGLFYVGELPHKNVIRKLCVEAGWDENAEDLYKKGLLKKGNYIIEIDW